MRKIGLLLLFITITCTQSNGQDPLRFANEVAAIQKKSDSLWDPSKETIVFTGSSSVRLWKDLQQRFPQHQILNTGFGGSQTSDLAHFAHGLVLRFNPKKVAIYEGDNDLAEGKKPKVIMANLQDVIAKIRANNPNTGIILIAAKPSLARWHLKREYKKLNNNFKKISKKDPLVHFADIWKPMLVKKKVMSDIFVEDGLHMNAKGYEIWYQVMKPLLE